MSKINQDFRGEKLRKRKERSEVVIFGEGKSLYL